MNSVKFQNDSYTLPSQWNELTTVQLEQIAALVAKQQPRIAIQVKLALIFMGMRLANRVRRLIAGAPYYYVKHGIRRTYLISPLQMAKLAECVSFLFEGDAVASRLTKQPYPVLKVGWFRKLYGASEALTNITFGEFQQAEIARAAYEATGDESYLNLLLAIIYREKAKNPADGDVRKPLRMDEAERRAKRFSHFPDFKKMVMLWYYNGCLAFLFEKFTHVFSQGTATGGESVSPIDSFMKLTSLLADGKLADVDSIREKYLYDALYILDEKVEQYEKNRK